MSVNTYAGRLPPSGGISSGSSPRAATIAWRRGSVKRESIGVRDGSMCPPLTSSTPGACLATWASSLASTSLVRWSGTSRTSHLATASLGRTVWVPGPP